MLILLSSFANIKGNNSLNFGYCSYYFMEKDNKRIVFIKCNISTYFHIIGGFCGEYLVIELIRLKFKKSLRNLKDFTEILYIYTF